MSNGSVLIIVERYECLKNEKIAAKREIQLAAAVYRVQHHVLQQKFGAEREHVDDNQ